jgi:DNA polymerase-3 subunit epsilon
MKSPRRIIPKPQFKLQNILQRLLKEPILYTEFLELLNEATDTFYDTPELEFELLLSNGLPLEFDGDFVYLKTTKTPIEEQTFCIVDIETNGGSAKKGYQIIELGAVKYKNGKILGKFESLVYAKEIPAYVQEVTKINLKMLEDAPRLEKVLKEFKVFLEDDVFVAHDIKFDYTFISDSFEKFHLGKLLNRKICSIDLAKRTIQSEKYGLSFLKEVLKVHESYERVAAPFYERCAKNAERPTPVRALCLTNLIQVKKKNNERINVADYPSDLIELSRMITDL